MNNDLTVLIVGFSKDRDVIPIQEFFFNHFWADCPFKKIFSIDDTTRFLNFESVLQRNPSFAKRLEGYSKLATPSMFFFYLAIIGFLIGLDRTIFLSAVPLWIVLKAISCNWEHKWNAN